MTRVRLLAWEQQQQPPPASRRCVTGSARWQQQQQQPASRQPQTRSPDSPLLRPAPARPCPMAAAAWRMLSKMVVGGRKEVMEAVAGELWLQGVASNGR